MQKKTVIRSVLIIVVVIGAFLRFWHLGAVPFRADEFLDINATVGYVHTGMWQAWDHNMGDVSTRVNSASDHRAWLYRWQVAFLFKYFPPTEAVARSVSALWGVLTIILIYFVAASLTQRRAIGLISAALYAVSVSAIEVDRTLRMYAMFAPVFLAFSWATFLTLERTPKVAFLKKIWRIFGVHIGYGIVALVLGMLSLHLHALTANIVFVIVGYIVLMGFVTWRAGVTWRDNRYVKLLALVFGTLAGLFIILPQMVASFTAGIVLWENHWHYIGHVLRDYAHPLMGVALYIIGISFLWYGGTSAQRRGAAWIDATTSIILCAAIFLWRRNVGPQYIFFVQPFIMMGVASGIYYGARYLQRKMHDRRAFIVALLCAAIFVPHYGYFFRENNTYHITSHAEMPNYRKVFTYITKHAKDGDVLITRNFRNYYWSGAHIKTFDFGSERSEEALKAEGKVAKVTRAYLESIVEKYPHGWFVFSENDEKFITKEVRAYAQKHFEKVSHANVRGPITVYRWDISNRM